VPPGIKIGPLTADELLEVWQGITDKSYSRPLLNAGDGNGLEVISQGIEQLARASRGIDLTTQALYIRASSAQTGPPAGGAAFAAATLTFRRSRLLDRPMVLGKGRLFVEEETTDWGDPVGIVARTGRLYTLVEDLVFHSGDSGPFDVVAVAERPGYGYNNPLPGTIKHVRQPGAGFFHERATVAYAPQPVVAGSPSARADMTTVNEADMPVPDHVGQYLTFTVGANVGKVGRVLSFQAPQPIINVGSAVQLAVEHSFESFAFVGTFTVGETIRFNTGIPIVGTGKVLGERVEPGGNKRITYLLLTGAEGTTATGAISGATATVDVVLFGQLLTSEAPVGGVGGASWRILDWAVDWGLVCTNVLSPSGGRLALLDEIGAERNVARTPGEDDEHYRARVAEVADVVSPNAIKRTLNRVLAPLPWCFREVGDKTFLPGMFFDGNNEPALPIPHGAVNDAYDTDVVVMTGVLTSGVFEFQEPAQLEDVVNNMKVSGYFGRLDFADTRLTLIRKVNKPPISLAGLRVRGLRSGATWTPAAYVVTPTVDARRFRYLLDYIQFRAFFIVGVPRLGDGEFGFAYDAGAHNAYDAAPFAAFYDGDAVTAAALYRNVWQAVELVRAGGVSWQLEIEDIGCP